MFREIDGGTCVDIQGMKCWLPKPGYLWDYETEAWVKDGVHIRDKKDPAECYWQRDKRWSLYMKWKAEEDDRNAAVLAEAKKNRRKPDPRNLWHHPQLHEFIADCWRWRHSGYWYSNNGVPTYITGNYWYYLSCYWMKSQYPNYRDVDRKLFYAWDYVDENPVALGLIYITKRRSGKSFIAGSIAVEKASRIAQGRVGMQSKTDKDAKKLFQRAIVAPFRRLPFFFQPETNLKGNQLPAEALKFESGRMDTALDEEMGSSIDFGPSTEEYYDGEELVFYIDDEFGKTREANVSERWDVVRFCLLNHEQKIVGKSLHITTVEKMEGGGGANAFKLWKDSDHTKVEPGTQTPSGLFKFFIPAQEAGPVNKYGFCNVEAELQKIEALLALQTDDRKVAALKQKMPRDEREAFMADAATCAFSYKLLNERYEDLKYLPAPMYRTGNFQWKDGVKDTEVIWVSDPNGRFLMAWEPAVDLRNRKLHRSGSWWPNNIDMACGGVDPYDHKVLTKDSVKTMSKGAICFVKLPNVLAPSSIDEGPCLLYANRAAAPEIFYEDVIMACVYYGCLVLIEDNKPGCINYMEQRGYSGYLAWLPGRNKPGISNTAPTSGGGVNGTVAALTDSYVSHHLESCVYPSLVESWLRFDVTNTTEFDEPMAFGFAKILQKTFGAGHERKSEGKRPDVRKVLPESMFSTGGRTIFG